MLDKIPVPTKKQAIVYTGGFFAVCFLAGFLFLWYIIATLPKIVTVDDYKPLLVSEVYDRNGEKIGEFFRERRLVVPFEKIPEKLVHAFVAAEDDEFFEHSGVNPKAIMRAMMANIKAGRKVQGGSTITQQTAKTLLLSQEKTYIRKIRDILLALRMEQNLTKQEILFLYLNQIYFGHGAYGIQAASEIYYRKNLDELTLQEITILAGLPQAPSRYSPVYHPKRAKERQKYVLGRMVKEEYITQEEADEALNTEVKVYIRKDYKKLAPYFLEAVRTYLVKHLGEKEVLNNGIQVYTTLDKELQLDAQAQVREGLRALDKRQGYRGPLKSLTEPEKIRDFLLATRDKLIDDSTPERIIKPDGTTEHESKPPLMLADSENKENIPEYIEIDDIVEGIVSNVDDKWGLVTVRFAERQGLIDMESMKWAREPDPEKSFKYTEIEKPSEALKVGDVIMIRVAGKRFYSSRLNKELRELKQRQKRKYKRPEEIPDFEDFARLELEQEPLVEGALISFGLESEQVLAMVGGYDFDRSEFNRALQAARQTGSSFKPIVYAAGLDHGFQPNSKIIDAPVVYETEKEEKDAEEGDAEGQEVGADEVKKWKPGNYGSKFTGDILYRNALIRSKNIPTIKISEKVGIDVIATYARRLGIFSPLNLDLSLGLGSSGVTLYEITKVFSTFGRLGRKITPQFLLNVKSREGEELIGQVSMEERFENEIKPIEEHFEKIRAKLTHGKDPETGLPLDENGEVDKKARASILQRWADGEERDESLPNDVSDLKVMTSKELPLYFTKSNQLMSPQTAYLTSSLLQGVVSDDRGTGRAARALGRPVAGKTGTTNGYYDAWFVGYSPQIATGVWVGYDEEKSMGVSETGGRAALPIWLQYMKTAHRQLPVKNFPVPDQIVFVSIDNESGKLASANSSEIVKQSFLEGTEPTATKDDIDESNIYDQEEKTFFFKQDLNE